MSSTTNSITGQTAADVASTDIGTRYSTVLTPEALAFIADLERRFGPQRRILLENRKLAQMRYDDGELSKIKTALGENVFAAGRHPESTSVFVEAATGETLADFLTLPAYDVLRRLQI